MIEADTAGYMQFVRQRWGERHERKKWQDDS